MGKNKPAGNVFCEWLLRIMSEKGISGPELERISNGEISSTNISGLRRGVPPQRPAVVARYAQALGVDLMEMKLMALLGTVQWAGRSHDVSLDEFMAFARKSTSKRVTVPVFSLQDISLFDAHGFPPEKGKMKVPGVDEYGASAYGILIENNEMYPAFQEGTVAILSPTMPLAQSAFGLVNVKSGDNAGAYFGRINTASSQIVIEIFKDYKTILVSKADVAWRHPVIATYRLPL